MSVINLKMCSEYINGARAAAALMIERYINKPCKKEDKAYIEAELRFIMASKDNMWSWLSSKDDDFRYCNHKHDKKGKVVYCEAYLQRRKEGGEP